MADQPLNPGFSAREVILGSRLAVGLWLLSAAMLVTLGFWSFDAV